MIFINPKIHPKSQWGFISKHMALQTPMGIGFLAGYLRSKEPNISIKIIVRRYFYLGGDACL